MADVFARGVTRVEATAEAEAEWSKHVEELAEGMLYTLVNSWMTGINTNVEGKNVRRVLQYQGGAPQYRAKCDEVAASGYTGMPSPRGKCLANMRCFVTASWSG
jgi:hypothetical protein